MQGEVKLEVCGGGVDVEPDHVRVDRLQDLEVLEAELLLPGQLLLVHVLDQVALRPAVHLHEVVLAGGHVVVVGVQQFALLLKELLSIVDGALVYHDFQLLANLGQLLLNLHRIPPHPRFFTKPSQMTSPVDPLVALVFHCQKWWRCWNQTLWGHNILSSCTRSSSSSPNDRAWQWCPKGRECTSWKDVLPLRCSLLPSL